MKVHRGRIQDAASLKEGENFIGDVWVDRLLEEGATMAYSVTFTPGARTHWHRDTGGQFLVVTAGSGRVVSRTGDGVLVRAGDLVWTDPDEEHWHGANADSCMAHLAVSLGVNNWLEPVSDEAYAAP